MSMTEKLALKMDLANQISSKTNDASSARILVDSFSDDTLSFISEFELVLA